MVVGLDWEGELDDFGLVYEQVLHKFWGFVHVRGRLCLGFYEFGFYSG